MLERANTESHLNAVVASKVKQSVLEHTAMTSGQYKPVTVEPVGILWIVPHDLVVQNMAHRGATHGQTRMTRIRLLNGIDGQESDRVYRLLDQ